jgi:hypothetical protein
MKERGEAMKKMIGAMKRVLHGGVFLLASTICLAALADDAYLANSDAYRISSFTNSANWCIGSTSGAQLGPAGAAIDSSYDYIVSNSKTLRTPTSSAAFGGNSLTVNSGCTLALCAGTAGCEYTFPGNGLTIMGFFVSWGGRNPVVKGCVTIPAGARVEMYDNTSSSSIGFDCSLSGQSSSTIWAYGYQNNICTVRFKGSTLSGYSGSIVCCTQDYAHRNVAPVQAQATTISIGTVETAASVTIHPYCTITAESAGDIVSLTSLDMKTNSTIAVVYDKLSKTASCIKVTNTLTHNEGPVKIAFEPNPTFNSWPDEEIVPDLPILKAPAGVTLSTNDFVLVTSAQFPAYDLSVKTPEETEDGLWALCVHQCGKVVRQTGTDSNTSKDTSSFVSGANWADNTLPSVTNSYLSEGGQQRAYGSVFPGRVLARIRGSLTLQVANVEIGDFRIIGSADEGMTIYNFAGNEATLSGHLHLVSANNFARLAGHGGTLTVASEIDGPGRMNIRWSNNGTPPAASKRVCTVKLLGMNDCFTGKIWADHISGYTMSDEVYHCVLQFADGRSLGGAMPSWAYNGHTLGDYLYLTPLATTTLERENCGIFVDGFARVVCNDGITFTVKEKTTWNGELKKLGAGTLAWGGDEPYFTTNGGTTPVADKNRLIIAEGTLKPCSSEAFQGLEVVISNGTDIAMDVPASATDGNIGQYGMRNTNYSTPFTLPTGGVTVRFEDAAGHALGLAGNRVREVAILTVSSAAAASVRGKLNISPLVHSDRRRFAMVPFERDNGDNSVTFGVKLVRSMSISFR